MGVDWLKSWIVTHGLAGSIPATSTVPRLSTVVLDMIFVFDILPLGDNPEVWTNLSPPRTAPKAVFWLPDTLIVLIFLLWIMGIDIVCGCATITLQVPLARPRKRENR